MEYNLYGNNNIHPSVTIGAYCDIGGVEIGEGSKIQTGVSIPRGWTLGKRVFVGPGARFANDPKPALGSHFEPLRGVVEDDVVIGMGALIAPGITLGKGCFIGMGAVVTKSVPPGETWVGNPASLKVLKHPPDHGTDSR